MGEDDLVLIIHQMQKYVLFRASLWTKLIACWLPTKYLSDKTRTEVEMINKGKDKMERSMDIRNIMTQ